ncbi:MAG: NDP-sugar synthase [Deltaproteobacteria bacterium]|nr:NDP-sugar synthase [Deltaproteobacteria bacterium]
MILAAGRGERLRPLTDHVPKPLFPILGEPIVVRTLRQLGRLGVDEVVMNLWHLGAKFRAALGAKCEGVRVRYVDEAALLGTGGGVRNARRYWGKRAVLVVNGKIDVDLGDLAWTHEHDGTRDAATLLLRRVRDDDPYTAIRTAVDKAALRVVGFGGNAEPGHRAMFTGVHLIEPRVLDRLPEGASCIVRQGYEPALGDGERLGAALHAGRWAAVETAKNYIDANLSLLGGEDAAFVKSGGATGRVRIERSYVHPSATVGDGATIIESVVWAGTVVPKGARLVRAIATPHGTVTA